jgi:hypothetical protein
MLKSRLAVAAVPAAIAVLASSGVAAAASPSVSKEVVSTRTTAPLTIPGTGVKKGARLPRGARLIFRTVTLHKGQRASLTLRAPAHSTLRGVVPAATGGIDFAVARPSHYVGRSAVTVRAAVAPKAGAGEHSARIWALVR